MNIFPLQNYELQNSSYLFQYGPTVGTFDFRTKLAEFLTKGYKAKVEAADLVLTAGATYGLHMILSTLIDFDGFVFIDAVTYMIALEAIAEFPTLKIIPVKLNDDGVDLKDLEEKLKEKKFDPKAKMFWGIYYTIPTFHNPTGILFSDGKFTKIDSHDFLTCECFTEIQQALIKVARKYEILIACDDVYNLLPFDSDTPPKRLYAYDSFDDEDFKGHVISNGTFSKLLSPGVRVGWMECAPRITKAFRHSGILKSGGAINNYTSGVVASLIELGLAESQLKKCLGAYKTQRDALCDVLDQCLPSSCSFIKPKGGYFIWIKLPEDCDGGAVSDYCTKNYKVFCIKGTRFSIENKFRNFVRLSFAFHPPAVLSEAGRKLCLGINEYLNISK